MLGPTCSVHQLTSGITFCSEGSYWIFAHVIGNWLTLYGHCKMLYSGIWILEGNVVVLPYYQLMMIRQSIQLWQECVLCWAAWNRAFHSEAFDDRARKFRATVCPVITPATQHLNRIGVEHLIFCARQNTYPCNDRRRHGGQWIHVATSFYSACLRSWCMRFACIDLGKALMLHENQIGDPGAEKLAQALPALTNFTVAWRGARDVQCAHGSCSLTAVKMC